MDIKKKKTIGTARGKCGEASGAADVLRHDKTSYWWDGGEAHTA